MKLSRGGSDAVQVREFDLVQADFVAESDQPFFLAEAKVSGSFFFLLLVSASNRFAS